MADDHNDCSGCGRNAFPHPFDQELCPSCTAKEAAALRGRHGISLAIYRSEQGLPDNTQDAGWVRSRLAEAERWGCVNVSAKWREQLAWLFGQDPSTYDPDDYEGHELEDPTHVRHLDPGLYNTTVHPATPAELVELAVRLSLTPKGK